MTFREKPNEPLGIDADKIAAAKQSILTVEQYRETPFANNERQRVYVFKLEKGDKQITYFGTAHINNPEDPLFDDIQSAFQEATPDMVYVEGWASINTRKDLVREVLQDTALETSKKEGENFFVVKLAVDAGIDFESPEPSLSDEIVHLLNKGFSKKDIFYFYTYRDIMQYQRENKNKTAEDCEKYLQGCFADFRRDSKWDAAECAGFETEILVELEVENTDKYYDQVDPIPWEEKSQTVLNRISQESSEFRDAYIVERIAEGTKHHNKIFVVYGSAHAVKQEPALRALLS